MKYRPPKIIKAKREAEKLHKKFWKVFFIEGGLFLLTSLLAVAGAFELNKLAEVKKVYLPTTSLQDFLFSFLFVTFFVLIFISYKKAGKFKELIYKGFFVITVFWGGMTVLNLFLPVFGAILIMGILIMFWFEFPAIWVHDILMILGLAGAASFFGLGFTPSVVVALLLIFSVYDFIAVYKTKHMLLMAKEMIEKKVILGFIIPKEIKYFEEKLKEVKPGGNFMILGGGDVVFPNLLAVSVIPSGVSKALIIVLFSLCGSFFSYWLFAIQKDKEPIPALPPVALFSIIGYFITLLLP
jgi:presenilin-like A22 family membrane protease